VLSEKNLKTFLLVDPALFALEFFLLEYFHSKKLRTRIA